MQLLRRLKTHVSLQIFVCGNRQYGSLIEDEEKATNAKKFISQLIAYADKTDVRM